MHFSRKVVVKSFLWCKEYLRGLNLHVGGEEDGAVGADARIVDVGVMIHFLRLYHAAKACSHSTGHTLLK